MCERCNKEKDSFNRAYTRIKEQNLTELDKWWIERQLALIDKKPSYRLGKWA
jgi:hypothetical protein